MVYNKVAVTVTIEANQNCILSFFPLFFNNLPIFVPNIRLFTINSNYPIDYFKMDVRSIIVSVFFIMYFSFVYFIIL